MQLLWLEELRRGLLIYVLFILVLVSAKEHRNILSCGETEIVDPLAEADVIVIGSGVGGTGFLLRFTSPAIQPNTTVLWFEKGHESFVAKNWPDDLSKQLTVLSPIPRKKMDWQPGLAWNAFGGGDACNSGGKSLLSKRKKKLYCLSLEERSIMMCFHLPLKSLLFSFSFSFPRPLPPMQAQIISVLTNQIPFRMNQ
jgi:hypothetical protein